MDLQLFVGGIPVTLATAATVQALSWGGILKTGNARRVAVLILALVYSLAWAGISLFPEIEPYVSVVIQALVGAALAALSFEGVQVIQARRNGQA